jgi:hypothetical protein
MQGTDGISIVLYKYSPSPSSHKQHYYQVRVFDVRQERSVGADTQEDGMDASSATSVRDLPI